jgi:hypothetical protein
VLEPVANDLWVASSPLVFLGFHIGTRMTVVRMAGGELWVHSPIALVPSLRARVDSLGEVRHIVAPNVYHHLFVKEWQAAYPKATLHAPAGLAGKRPDLRVDVGIEGAERAPWAKLLAPVHIDGCILDETIFVHRPTRTLITSDLLENFQTSDHWATRMYLKASGLHGKVGFSRLFRVMYRDRAAAKKSLDRLHAHEFDRVILAHGDVLGAGGKAALAHAYAFLSS